MKQKKTRRVIVRLTENQFKNLMDSVITENQNRYTTSDLIREAVVDKLNKIKEDAIFGQRPEQLSVAQFIALTQKLEADAISTHQ